MLDERDWDEIERDTLTSTNAQRVYQLLKKLEERRDRVQTRWIWELLQNARDAAPDGPRSLRCSVKYDQGQVLLEHNGRHFERREIARIIYHGSTKAEDRSKLGQYGSGLLTTHLLSREIFVSGRLVDGRGFNFPVRRVPTSIQSIDVDMRESARRFNASLACEDPVHLSHGFTTRFRYSVEDGAGDEVVTQGISSLERLAPFILAFNEEFSALDLQSPDGAFCFNVSERTQLKDCGMQEITVRRRSPSSSLDSKFLLIRRGDTSIAVPTQRIGESRSCLQAAGTPKLFLGLPLIGTESFSFPAVINSFQFTPSDEDRDGVNLWLNDKDKANLTNQEVVAEACTLLIQMIEFAGASAWDDVFVLAEMPRILDRDWLVSEKLRRHLIENLLNPLLGTPAVLCEYGEGALPPLKSVLPNAEEDEDVVALWGLLSGLKALRPRLPRRREVAGWNRAVKSWAGLRECASTEFSGVIDGGMLACRIESMAIGSNGQIYGSLNNLQNALVEGVGAAEWLDDVLAFLRAGVHAGEVSNRQIILNQAGHLRELSGLYRDGGIDEELKGIADSIDINLREQLRDKRLASLSDEDGKGVKENREVVKEIIAKLNEMAVGGHLGGSFTFASTRAFAWIVEHEKWDLLSGFPGFSQRKEGGDIEIVRLGTEEVQGEDIPLAPVPAWDEDLQPFSELFPPSRILSTEFYAGIPDANVWQTLAGLDIVRTSIMASRKFSPRFLPDEPLPKSAEGAEHRAREEVDLTYVVYLRGRGRAIERAGRSLRRACLFWRFVTEWLVVNDAQGLETNTAACTCGDDHYYYQSRWLVTVVENSWVPLGNDRHATPTAHSLGRLRRHDDTLPFPDNPIGDRLFEAIGVSRFDLFRESISEDAQARVKVDNKLMKILIATGNEPDLLDKVPNFLELLSKDGRILNDLEDLDKERQEVRRNQQFGNLVESLVEKALKKKGFVVERTGVGSDLAVKLASDEAEGKTEDDAGQLKISRENDCWLVEVKATRSNDARMTPRQARTAVEKGDHFLLCVVPVDSDVEPTLDVVKDDLRFVGDIGERVEGLCKYLDHLELAEGQIINKSADGVSLIVRGGNKRISIARSVWEIDGFPLEGLLDRLLR